MAHRDITLTKNARSILEGMPSASYDDAMDYLSNAVLRDAADAGQPLRLFATGQTAGSWMEVQLDANANVDIQLWKTPSNARTSQDGPVACEPSNFKLTALTKTKNNLSTLEFRRKQSVIAQMSYAGFYASKFFNLDTFQSIMNELNKYVPWVDQINTLSHRVHGSAAGPHFLSQAMLQMSFFGELLDEDLVRSMPSPATTAQALLAVHATVHASAQKEEHNPTPGLYALESPGHATTYLFVQRQPIDENDNKPFGRGTHIWLDHSSLPIFLNEVKDGSDARFANLTAHPDPAMAAVAWMPDGPSKYGMLDTLTDWDTLMAQGFNPATRQLLDGLAQATPRAMAPSECMALAERWMNAQTPTQTLWEDNKSKRHRTTLVFDTSNKSHLSLAMWGQYAAQVWADQYPTEHAVLNTLLPKMESLGAIEEWRLQMRAMSQSAPEQNAAAESFPLEALVGQPT